MLHKVFGKTKTIDWVAKQIEQGWSLPEIKAHLALA